MKVKKNAFLFMSFLPVFATTTESSVSCFRCCRPPFLYLLLLSLLVPDRASVRFLFCSLEIYRLVGIASNTVLFFS